MPEDAPVPSRARPRVAGGVPADSLSLLLTGGASPPRRGVRQKLKRSLMPTW